MTVTVPKSASLSPWETLLCGLQRARALGEILFAQIQKKGNRRSGIIIGGWDENGNLGWYYSGGSGDDAWKSFTDDRIAQCPHLYKRLRDAIQRIELLRNHCASAEYRGSVTHVGLANWIHPEAYDQPLDDYVRLTEGEQFPGSPSQ